MRKISVTLVAVATLVGFAVPVAEAGSTCKMVPSWCPADTHQDSNKGQDFHPGDNSGGNVTKSTSVPEPGALALLFSGVTAVGGIALRRKRAKKD
jgi:PEP-CTERM motif